MIGDAVHSDGAEITRLNGSNIPDWHGVLRSIHKNYPLKCGFTSRLELSTLPILSFGEGHARNPHHLDVPRTSFKLKLAKEVVDCHDEGNAWPALNRWGKISVDVVAPI